jgi:hypothetical protein
VHLFYSVGGRRDRVDALHWTKVGCIVSDTYSTISNTNRIISVNEEIQRLT